MVYYESYVIHETYVRLRHDSGVQDADPAVLCRLSRGWVVILFNFGQGVVFIVIESGNLAPSSSFSFPACYSQVFKQVLLFIQNFQGSKALQETFFGQGPVADSIVHVSAISCISCISFTFRTNPQEKPEKEAFVTELRDFETCPDAAHWRLEGPKGWAMLLEITEALHPYCTNPTPCLHTFRLQVFVCICIEASSNQKLCLLVYGVKSSLLWPSSVHIYVVCTYCSASISCNVLLSYPFFPFHGVDWIWLVEVAFAVNTLMSAGVCWLMPLAMARRLAPLASSTPRRWEMLGSCARTHFP